MSEKRMTQCSVKKEIIPHGTRYIGKPGQGALISFSGMESDSAHFSQPGAFVSGACADEDQYRYKRKGELNTGTQS
jgi:hypothetical protein